MNYQYIRALEQTYPWINWREPVVVAAGAESRYGCRACISLHGLTAGQVKHLPATYQEWAAHMEKVHGIKCPVVI